MKRNLPTMIKSLNIIIKKIMYFETCKKNAFQLFHRILIKVLPDYERNRKLTIEGRS